MNVNTMVTLQLTLFLLLGVGYYTRKRGFITSQSRKSITDLFIQVILPCNIIHSFQIEWSVQIFRNCAAVLAAAFGAQLLYLLLSRVLFIKVSEDKKPVLEYAVICSNAGFMGNPIAEAVYGSEGLLYASIALIPLRIFMWSAGLSLFTKTTKKNVIRQLLTHPCIIAVAAGFILMLTQVRLPAFVNKGILSVSSCTTAVSMIIIGTILAEIDWRTIFSGLLFYYSAVRLLVIPLLVFGILTLLGADRMVTGVTVLLAAMPAGSTTAMLAEKYGANSRFASACVFLSTLLSLATLPLFSLLL